jgi:uncharacterized protein (TIGR02597 family)
MKRSKVFWLMGTSALDVPANTDAIVSVGFDQQPAFTGAVSSVAGPQVTVSGTPFTGSNFANLYYVRFTSGAKAGFWSTVSSNTDNTLTLADAAAVSGVIAGDSFVLQPHQTLITVFPDNLEGASFIKSPSSFTHSTEVLTMNTTTTGINKSPASTYFYLTVNGSNAWRKVGSPPATDFNNTVLPPDTYYILRNKATNSLQYVTLGVVETDTLARTLSTLASANDVYAVSGRPVPMTLAQLGLGGTPAFVSSPSSINRKDTLLTFNNAASGQNKSPSATYYYINAAGNVGWRKVGDSPTTSYDNSPVIDAGGGFIIRKATGTPSDNTWTENAPY